MPPRHSLTVPCALNAMDYELSGPFITSMFEFKIDTNIMFKWRKFSKDTTEVPHYWKLLELINLNGQASQSSIIEHGKKLKYEGRNSAKLLESHKENRKPC